MITFKEFINSQSNRDDIKHMVMSALEASDNAEDAILSAYDNFGDRILNHKELGNIIEVSDKRGAILQLLKTALQDGSTITIGELINMIA